MEKYNSFHTEDNRVLMETLNKAIDAFNKLLDTLNTKQAVNGTTLLDDTDVKKIDPERK